MIENNTLIITWNIDDIRDIEPEFTDEQCLLVLHKANEIKNDGINKDVLEQLCDDVKKEVSPNLYPVVWLCAPDSSSQLMVETALNGSKFTPLFRHYLPTLRHTLEHNKKVRALMLDPSQFEEYKVKVFQKLAREHGITVIFISKDSKDSPGGHWLRATEVDTLPTMLSEILELR